MGELMQIAKPLPDYLVTRYRGWKATGYEKNKAWYRHLASDGQHPRAMVISCCDSRVHVTSIFGADQGEFFIHRNIANLVPPHEPDGRHHGTSAAVEYAVTALKVAHIIVLGHSQCGGVQGFHDMCASGDATAKSSFVGAWVELLRPGFERLGGPGKPVDMTALEHEAVLVSLDNLGTFPFVEQAVAEGRLTLHGCWHDIGSGTLKYYSPEEGAFIAV